MFDEEQLVKVRGSSFTMQHFTKLGYDIKVGQEIEVKARDLPQGSHCKVNVTCDFCGKTFTKEYRKYILHGNPVCCSEPSCIQKKVEIRCMEKYGVRCTFQNPEFQNKIKRTNLEKYGVENPLQNPEIKKRAEQTNLEKYGVKHVLQSPEFQNKIKLTNLERYGVENPMQNLEIQEKTWQTNLKRYGVQYPAQNSESQEKRLNTLLSHGNTPTSKQQIALYDMLKEIYPNNKIQSDVPVSSFIADIILYINDCKINVEYDGWYWHQDAQRDIIRDKVFQSNGYKVLRVKSGKKLPDPQQITNAVDKLLSTDQKYTQIILDDWKNPA